MGVGLFMPRMNYVSVRRGFLWGINVHSIHKEYLLIFSSVYIWNGYWESWSIGRCTKAPCPPPQGLKKISRQQMCEFHLICICICCCHMVIVLNDSLVHFLLGFTFGFKDKLQALVCAYGLSRSWLRYCALVFVCLMSSLSCMLWLRKNTHWLSL